MLKSCAACGKIHDEKIICREKKEAMKKRSQKKITHVEKFRWSNQWRRAAKERQEKDMYMCRVCLTGEHETQQRYTTWGLSVHHIDPLVEAWDKRLDQDNLITLCRYHHEKAEAGDIPREWLHELASVGAREALGLLGVDV